MFDSLDQLEKMSSYAIQLDAIAGVDLSPKGILDKVVELSALPMFQGITKSDCEAIAKTLISLHDVTIAGPVVVKDKNHKVWLSAKKAEITPYYWERYERLLSQKNLPRKIISELGSSSEMILDLMHDPTDVSPWDRRGLVMGNVQSGKTQNYIGLIAKAADAGYKVIIVIAGIHNNLRNQTQQRIDEGFIGQHWTGSERKSVGVGLLKRERKPSSFTATNRDFNSKMAESIGIPLRNLNEPAIFVIKKNASTLSKLIEWLRDNNVDNSGKILQPLLLIDDEADNASINIKNNSTSPSTINSQIRELLSLFDRSVYVGYTATPFANIFIDPDSEHEMLEEDLFPRSFIVNLESPSNYFGAQKIFGEDSDKFIVPINDFDETLPLNHKKDFHIAGLPDSLCDAVHTFIIARAIRISRGQGAEHSSMLVNVSRFVNIHGQIKAEIDYLKKNIEACIRVDGKKSNQALLKNPELANLKRVFDEIFVKSGIKESWDEISPLLLEAIAPIEIAEIHSKSETTLRYEDYSTHGLHVIAIGGFSLSRGLTLEGLTVSYFLRNSVMYDTLLQMGRWFGYRNGYEDLCRIYMTEESAGWYAHIAESIEELREDLRQMQLERMTPSDFGLKVRCHPDSLIITAKNKAGRSSEIIQRTTWSNRFIETFSLSTKYRESNLLLLSEFGDELLNEGIKMPDQSEGSWYQLSNVPFKSVMDLINRFSLTPFEKARLEPREISKYIKLHSERWPMWDLVVPSVKASSSSITFMDKKINCQSRTVASCVPQHGALSITLSSRQMLASRGIERAGLSQKQMQEAERLFEKDNQERLAEGREATKNIAGRSYRQVRDRPLLMVHFIKSDGPEGKYASEINNKVFAAWGISFPNIDENDESVTYKVNTTWLRENMNDEDDDDESNF